jgi:hypothetical protein
VAEFVPFNSLEEMQAFMQRSEDAANANLQDAQVALRDDVDNERYWMNVTPYGFIEYGHCFSRATLTEHVAKVYAKHGDEDDPQDEIDSILDTRKRGYLFGRAYATINVKGSTGSTHVSQVMPISEEMFNLARDAGWKLQ